MQKERLNHLEGVHDTGFEIYYTDRDMVNYIRDKFGDQLGNIPEEELVRTINKTLEKLEDGCYEYINEIVSDRIGDLQSEYG